MSEGFVMWSSYTLEYCSSCFMQAIELFLHPFIHLRRFPPLTWILTSYSPTCRVLPHLTCQVFKQGLAKSIHHARALIKHRHIR